jgi:ClpP class serine protease
LSSILKNIQNGVKLDIPNEKYNSISLITKSETKLIQREWQLENSDSFEGIGVIDLNGPITKGGGMSSSGMIELSNSMLKMSKDSRIQGFVIKVDSGGGASGAVEIMVDAINEVKKTKPVYSVVTKGGMAGSAAYGIASASTKMYSEDKMNIVGSVGTMISFDGFKANSESPDGMKHITVYASKSTMKNKAFEEALNNDNYELLVNELLDPINENFINLVLSNRPQLKGSNFDNGHTVFSKDGIGTFIDGIASFDEVVQMVLTDSKNNLNTNFNNKKKMNKEEFKSANITAYNEIVSEGVTAERERVASWMVYAKADPEMVTTGIESGASITPSQREKLIVKMSASAMLGDLNADSAKPIVTAESKTEVENTEVKEEVKSAMNFELKTK